MEQFTGHPDRIARAHFGEAGRYGRRPYLRGEFNERRAKIIALLAAGFAFGSLLVFRTVLPVEFLTELTTTVTFHPGTVLIDTIGSVSVRVDIIVGNREIFAESLGKECQ